MLQHPESNTWPGLSRNIPASVFHGGEMLEGLWSLVANFAGLMCAKDQSVCCWDLCHV